MKYKSQLVTQASGSMGGLTASHNRGGLYLRARSIPVNPSSAFQQAIRNAILQLATGWSTTLTALQRAAWEVYADAVLRTDSLGEPRKLTGLNWYVACNAPRLQVGLTRIDAAPTVFSEAALTTPTIVSATAATEVLSIGFTNTDEWATAVGGSLLVYTSPPQNAGVQFYKGPYRFAGRINGAVVPPTTPQPITAAFPFAVGNLIHVQFRAVQADGRISPPFRAIGTGV